ncbi:RNA polymerase sigma factor RpoD/SigA [Porphyromonas sp. HMSC065F10]|uniref:sigma-70 family RNA polymerase sigma factor n=1 Tax=Porphyromonas sp. HMSC065F10 TaxID=1739394 RepID=UPI0008A384D4|nr:RNA polymerase sigma factor RpoD/SigA [Porphyromonas sp. HMSC065F10]OFR41242.1 RNA polymerase subunit sigma [Porphyromonas sp. HMSC065F10]
MRQLKIEKSITSRDDAVMNRYMKEVAKEEMITADEEAELAMRIQRHDEHSHEAVDKLVRANLRFVISVAKQYQDLGLPLIDLINEGNLGMIRAAQGFDGSRGFKFITYAVWWIRQSILKALGDQGRIVRLPQNQVGNVTKLKNARDRFEQIHQRQPSPEELADELDMDLDKVIDIIQIDKGEISVDKTFEEGETNTLLDVMTDDDAPEVDHRLINESLSDEISVAMNCLNERERFVLVHTFGLGGQPEMSLDEIGAAIDLSRERVRQIREKAIRQLRTDCDKTNLRSYLG